MRRRRRRGLTPGEVVFELRALLLLIHGNLGFDHALGDIQIAQLGPGGGVVVHPLGHDVARTGQSLRRIGHGGLGAIDFVFASGVALRFGRHIGGRILLPEDFSQGFETFLLRDGGLGAFFRAERKVDIFQRGQRFGPINFRLQLLAEQLALGQRRHDGFAAFVEFGQLFQAVTDGGDLNFIQFAGAFLAVAGNEGNGRALLEQERGGRNLTGLEL